MNIETVISGLILACPVMALLGYALYIPVIIQNAIYSPPYAPRLVRGVHRSTQDLLDPADKPRGVGGEEIKGISHFFRIFISDGYRYRQQWAVQWAGYWLGLGFLIAITLLICLPRLSEPVQPGLLSLDSLNLVLVSLVLLVSFVVHRFSLRYLQGDRLYYGYFIRLTTLTLSAVLMTLADNVFLFGAAWLLSNLLLVQLMIHKAQWQAAKNSGLLALCTLTAGSLALLLALLILSWHFATGSLAEIGQEAASGEWSYPALSVGLILFAALAQSALYPFHRWLLSSLNSPTPVSALMHAGLVNGGGILMVKFAPLLLMQQGFLMVLFLFGAVSALLGTLWKLLQSDMKKMLACSTMAQMGFMMMQCGVGLFAAAIAHLCWHGLFKAYLFLSSGSALKFKKSAGRPPEASVILFITSLLGGIIAMVAVSFITHQPLTKTSAFSFVLFFAFIAGAQLLLSWRLSHRHLPGLVSGMVLAGLFGLLYGFSIHLMESLLPELTAIQAPGLSWLHWVILGLFAALWLAFNLGLLRNFSSSRLGGWLYINALNGSQPGEKTITAVRTDYQY